MSKFGIEPGALHGRGTPAPRRTQADADDELIARAHAMDAKMFRKKFPSGSAQADELNAALLRQALRRRGGSLEGER